MDETSVNTLVKRRIPSTSHFAIIRQWLKGADPKRAVLIGYVSLATHIVALFEGFRISSTSLSNHSLSLVWHLLPVPLLRHDLWSSVLRSHSQPPLFSLATGFLIRDQSVQQLIVANTVLIAFSVLLAVSAFGLMREIGVTRNLATFVVLILIIADPAQLLYPSTFFYTVPTAATVTALGWMALRWVRTRSFKSGLTYGILGSVLILTNSSFQIYNVALATVPLIYVLRNEWRRVVAALTFPLLIVGLWYVNVAVQFGTFSTSSWTGMNLARVTTMTDSKADLSKLVEEGVISRTSLTRPFSCLREYGSLGIAPPTGHQALDIRDKIPCPPGFLGFAIGRPNYNNIAFLKISDRYLSDDLKWIRHRPLTYLKHVFVGFKIWSIPSEQSSPFMTHQWTMGGYTAFYDHAIELQPALDWNVDYNTVFHNKRPSWTNISFTNLVITCLSVFILPILILRRRKVVPLELLAGATWIWIICTSVFVLSLLIEIGENNRFRFQLGALPIVGAVKAVQWIRDTRSNKLKTQHH